MQLLEDATITLQRSDLKRYPIFQGGTFDVRQPGLHVSGILKEVAIQLKLFDAAKEMEDEAIPFKWALGLAWEEFACSMYRDTLWQPGAIEVDGIWMTSDGLTPTRLDEFKLTWKKVMAGAQFIDPQYNWYYLTQGRAYCKGYEVDTVTWHVAYVNGDYKGSGPIYKRFTVKFTEAEIENNWKMILNHRHLGVPE